MAIATTPETEAGEASETVVPGNEVAVGAEETAATEDSPFAAFFESLSQFLTATIDGLGQLQGGFDLSAGGSFRLTTHFKLEVLKSVMVQAAPEDRREGAAQAGEAVSDALLGSGSAPAESANAQDPTAVV